MRAALVHNTKAVMRFAEMNREERENVIKCARTIRSGEEMNEFVASLTLSKGYGDFLE